MSVTYPNTKNESDIVVAVKELLESNPSIGLKKVWDADPNRVPVWPSAAVLGGTQTTGGGSPTGTGMGLNYFTNHQFTIYVMVFYVKLVPNDELELATLRYAESVRDEIHANKTLNGLVYQGWVTQIEPGEARRGGAKFRAARLTAVYSSKTFI